MDENLPVRPYNNMRSEAGTGGRSLNNPNENEMDLEPRMEERKIDIEVDEEEKMDEEPQVDEEL